MPTEKFSNNATSTLNGNITNVAASLIVNVATSFPTNPQFRILIDSEIIIVGAVAGTTFSSLTRGADNTTAASHSNGATVTLIITAGSLGNLPRSMTTSGDMEYLNSTGAPTRLAAPANGSYLVNWASGVPSWVLPTSTTKLDSKAYNSVSQTIPAGGTLVLLFDTNQYDHGGIHSTITNTSRFTVPTGGAGLWLIIGSALFTFSGGNIFDIRILKNGDAAGIALNQFVYVNTSTISQFLAQVSVMDEAADGDYYEIEVTQNTGGSVSAQGGIRYTWGSAARLAV